MTDTEGLELAAEGLGHVHCVCWGLGFDSLRVPQASLGLKRLFKIFLKNAAILGYVWLVLRACGVGDVVTTWACGRLTPRRPMGCRRICIFFLMQMVMRLELAGKGSCSLGCR